MFSSDVPGFSPVYSNKYETPVQTSLSRRVELISRKLIRERFREHKANVTMLYERFKEH